MNDTFIDIEFIDYQNLHESLVKLYAYEIALFEHSSSDFAFIAEILSISHDKAKILGSIQPLKHYKVRVHNLLID